MINGRHKLRLVASNQNKRVKLSDTTWLFQGNIETMPLKNFVEQLDHQNFSKRLVQLEYILNHFSEIFQIWNHPSEKLKIDAETKAIGTEILANLGFDYLAIQQYQKAAYFFELLVYEIEEPDFKEFDYLLAYLTCLTNLGDTRRLELLIDSFPEIIDFPFYYLPYYYALLVTGNLNQLEKHLQQLDLNFPEFIDLMLLHNQIVFVLENDDAIIEELNISEEAKDFISAMLLYVDFELNLEVLYDYVIAKYTYSDPKRIDRVQSQWSFE